MQLRQPIEGDRVISVQNVNEGCHMTGGVYNPNSISIFINDVEYPLPSINSLSFGFLSFNTPVPLKSGDTVRVQSNCIVDSTDTFITRPTNFTISAVDATICNNTSDVTISYNDVIRVFLASINSEFELFLNDVPLSISDFDYQQHQTTTFFTDGSGKFKGTVNTDNTSALSKLNYTPSNTLKIIPKGGYFVVRFGVIEFIFNNGELRRANFATGEFDVNTGISYDPDDIFEIISTNSSYVVEHNGVEIYDFDKEITLTTTGGSITPNPATLNTPSVWTLPVVPGNQTVTAQFLGGGVSTSTMINVDYCRATADSKNVNVTRGTNDNPIPSLSGTTPSNCTPDGFRITELPDCVTVKLNGVEVEVNDEIEIADAADLTVDVPTECSTPVTLKYITLVTGSGCSNSLPATITISPSGCAPTWVNDGSPICVDCIRVQPQINTTQSCSGGPSTRNLPLGDNSACLQPTWVDTGETRCNNCTNEKKQENVNPCYTGNQTRWISNPGGSDCNVTPNWEVVSGGCLTDGIIKYNVTVSNINSAAPNNTIKLITDGTGENITDVRIKRDSNGISHSYLLDQIVSSVTSPKGKLFILLPNYSPLVLEILTLSAIGDEYVGTVTSTPISIIEDNTYTNVTVGFTTLLSNNCFRINIEKDVNICSPTYNSARTNVVDEVCKTLPAKYEFTGTSTCVSCQTLFQMKDVQLCSSTYGSISNQALTEIETFYIVRHQNVGIANLVINGNITSGELTMLIDPISTNLVDMGDFIDTILIPNKNKVNILISDVNTNLVARIVNVTPVGGKYQLVTQIISYVGNTQQFPSVPYPLSVKFQLLQGATKCDVTPNYIPLGEYECIACVEKEYLVDSNPCSFTYLSTQLVDKPDGTACNKIPEYVTTSTKRCNGEFEEVKKVNINPCYDGGTEEIWTPTGNICFCEKSIRIKNICSPEREIAGVIVKRLDTPSEENRLISFTQEKITFRATPIYNKYLIIIVDVLGVENRITITTNCIMS